MYVHIYVCVQFLPLLNISSRAYALLFFFFCLMLYLEVSVCHSIDSFFILFLQLHDISCTIIDLKKYPIDRHLEYGPSLLLQIVPW